MKPGDSSISPTVADYRKSLLLTKKHSPAVAASRNRHRRDVRSVTDSTTTASIAGPQAVLGIQKARRLLDTHFAAVKSLHRRELRAEDGGRDGRGERTAHRQRTT